MKGRRVQRARIRDYVIGVSHKSTPQSSNETKHQETSGQNNKTKTRMSKYGRNSWVSYSAFFFSLSKRNWETNSQRRRVIAHETGGGKGKGGDAFGNKFWRIPSCTHHNCFQLNGWHGPRWWGSLSTSWRFDPFSRTWEAQSAGDLSAWHEKKPNSQVSSDSPLSSFSVPLWKL